VVDGLTHKFYGGDTFISPEALYIIERDDMKPRSVAPMYLHRRWLNVFGRAFAGYAKTALSEWRDNDCSLPTSFSWQTEPGGPLGLSATTAPQVQHPVAEYLAIPEDNACFSRRTATRINSQSYLRSNLDRACDVRTNVINLDDVKCWRRNKIGVKRG